MRLRTGPSALAVAVAVGWALPAQAQSADAAQMQQELAEMRAQMQRMAERIDSLESQLAGAQAQAAAANQAAASAVKVATEVKDNPPVKVAWKGAPQIEGKDGWSFKPRGRMQIDAGTVSSPAGITDASLGFGSELRRVYLGVEGSMPGGFGYRAEVDVANSSVEITDLYLTYAASKDVTVTVGQLKPFWGLEEITSDLFTSFTERAAINTSFGFERRLGVSAAYAKGPLLVQGGVFTDNVGDLNDDENNSLSFNGRAVFMPKLGDSQLHIGGSVQRRELNRAGQSVRYRTRPFLHTPDLRLIDTGNMVASSETGYGLEAAWISGRLHATGEAHWQKVNRLGALADPTFFGGYAEAGVFLTGGDTRGYKGGVFDRVKPKNSVGKGGIGAIELNLRYDYLDLVDAGIVGGKQDTYAVSLVWTPTDYTRFIANYGRVNYDSAAVAAAAGDRSYGVDAFGVRAQLDF